MFTVQLSKKLQKEMKLILAQLDEKRFEIFEKLFEAQVLINPGAKRYVVYMPHDGSLIKVDEGLVPLFSGKLDKAGWKLERFNVDSINSRFVFIVHQK